mgnify:CR=1 FL=1
MCNQVALVSTGKHVRGLDSHGLSQVVDMPVRSLIGRSHVSCHAGPDTAGAIGRSEVVVQARCDGKLTQSTHWE